MKKFIFFSLLILLLMAMVSCSESEKDQYAKNYPELLPDQEKEYQLLSISDEITLKELEKKDIYIGVRNIPSLETVNEEYPQLKLEKAPAYVLFDINGLVYKTYDYDKLIKFLKENPEHQL
ncbi:hypothetical protein GCM10009001_07470 [Virgibacillus siamensis]|uniref:Uncharacterized protein n=1 Tax=Virgibacillus siamensis TaxID=480071 RepID=A0ABN1FMG9_9BACI